jgi:ATP-dependent Lon protease
MADEKRMSNVAFSNLGDIGEEKDGQLPVEKAGSVALPDQNLPPNLFILPTNSSIIYPSLMAPLVVTPGRFVATVEEAISRNRMLGLILTREEELTAAVKPEQLYEYGVAVRVLKRIKMPDGSVNLLIQSLKRFRSKKVLSDHPHLLVETEYLEDEVEKDLEMDALVRSVIQNVKSLSEVNPFFTDEMRLAMINASGPGTVADLVAFALALPKSEAQDFLETISVKKRFEKILLHLRREQDVADVQKKITDEVNTKLTKLQREFFLKEQMKSIRRELGQEVDGKEKSAQTFREKVEASKMPEEIKKVAFEEIEKFETISDQSPEYNITRNYLDTLCALPWGIETEDQLSLGHARKVLDEDHFGLEKVKERILEVLAVRKLKNSTKGSIICLVGPPGVGKTSIGKSVAKAMGRNFFRFSLGGMRDEAEIKGHRRTYIGAMPGKVINAMKRAGSQNAVLMLDEIDKLGSSYQGDPASALLEVLDPEQNSQFVDHYLDLPFDLSKVLFIATANQLDTIPAPLLDRMEVIEVGGYTLEEKEIIASEYIIPKEILNNGLTPNQVKIEKTALRKILLDYAREPGLRQFQQVMNKIFRKAAAAIVHETEAPVKTKLKSKIIIRQEDLVEWLGPKRYTNEMAERITAPGVVVGLAWTAVGGDILFIEATDFPGTSQMKLTGQMGEVMSESASIAWSYVKKKVGKEKIIDPEYFKTNDFHLHIPAGAIPKDGPSAGITMASAFYSLVSGRRARQKVAMTGELSLIGKVLPVGGIKEKLLAARRSGVLEIVMPKQNEKDLYDLPKDLLASLKIHFVSHVEEVFDLVLEEGREVQKSILVGKAKVIRTKTLATKKPPLKKPTLKKRVVRGSRASR